MSNEQSHDGWVGVEHMYDPPNWYGVSPDVVALRGRPWNQDPNDVPWLDRPDALDRIAERQDAGALTAQEAEYLRQWAVDGSFVVEAGIAERDLLERFNHDLDSLWTADDAVDGLQIMSLHLPGREPGPISHAELLTWPLADRVRVRDSQVWRIHYYHPHSEAAHQVTRHDTLVRMSGLLLDAEPVLINAIGFKFGSQVSLHQDIDAYHIHPANRLIGVWVACEDVNPDAGPLTVYPGTHRTPQWPGWANYPQTNLRTCHNDTRDAQEAYLARAVQGIEPKTYVIHQGDVIFQHPLQIHRGEAIRDRSASRRSMVIHYSIPGGDRMHQVTGPFNW